MTASSTVVPCTVSADQTITVTLSVTVDPLGSDYRVSVGEDWGLFCTEVDDTTFNCTKAWSGTSNIPFTAVLTDFDSGGEQ